MNLYNLTILCIKLLKNSILMCLCKWMLKECNAKNPIRGVTQIKTLCFLEKKR